MKITRMGRIVFGAMLVASLAACGGYSSSNPSVPPDNSDVNRGSPAAQPKGRLGDLFSKSSDPNTSVRVNKYIWNAALEVLNFLPLQSVDPFTGVITTGYGVPPGGGRAVRATIYVQDPALDARSLNIAMEGQGGRPVAAETVQAIEDAILTRARQLRIQDGKL